MEGEFDQEINVDGWGPNSKNPEYISLGDQIKIFYAAVLGGKPEKERKQEKENVMKDIEGLMNKNNIKLTDTKSLYWLIGEQERNCALKKKEAEDKGNGVRWTEKGKWKKEAEKQDAQRSKWYNYGMLCRGIIRKFQKPPPPYPNSAPSAPSSVGLYPVLNVTGGQLDVRTEERSQIKEIKQETLNIEEEPFSGRNRREQRGRYTSTPKSRTPKTQLKVKKNKQVVIRGIVEGEWDADEWTDIEEEREESLVGGDENRDLERLESQAARTLAELEDSVYATDVKERAAARAVQALEDHKTGKKQRPMTRSQTYREDLCEGLNLPLLEQGGREVYKPWRIGDVTAVAEKMPSVREGGGLWMDTLDGLTQGMTLAVGDVRAVMGRCMTASELREVEKDAGISDTPDDMPLRYVVGMLGAAMRQRFPLPNPAAIPKISWDPTINPREFLEKTKTQWLKTTGRFPKEGVDLVWYRKAVTDGLPLKVRTQLESNPDLPGCDPSMWERHIVHHLQRAKDEKEKDEEEEGELKRQLLRLQIGKAKQEVNEEKKKDKVKRQMVSAVSGGEPDLYPIPDWGPQNLSQLGNMWRGGVNRGQRGRPYGRGAGGRSWGSPPGVCFTCGQPGHWSRECPNVPPQRRGPRGRGGPMRGGPAQRGYVAPNAAAAPGQFPLWEEHPYPQEGEWEQQ